MPRINWVIVLCIPNGGTTAFARTLLTADDTSALTSRAEGQWLIPEMCADIRRWDPSYLLDYQRVGEIWRSKALKDCGSNDALTVIEKSPPNLVRYRSIVDALLPDNANLIAFSRDPYAVISSWARKPPELIAKQWGWPEGTPETSDEFFESLAEIWILRAHLLVEALADCVSHVRYEDFCDRPKDTLHDLSRKLPLLKGADPNTNLKIKSYPAGPIVNMNEVQIAMLDAASIEAISRKLSTAPELLRRLGYNLRSA